MARSPWAGFVIVLACALFLPSCGPGTDFELAGGGIGGSGRNTGEITGFGSVFVNGVEWDTDEAEIYVDEDESDESALQVGMVVTLFGDADDDGETGVAFRIDYDDDLEGPISAIEELGEDQKLLTVLGASVLVDREDTTFEDTTFDDLAVDDVVEVSGFEDGDGVLVATRLEFEDALELGTTEVELRGEVTGFNGDDEFEINGITVIFDPEGVETELDDLEGGIEDGLFVEVEGVLIDETTVEATEIEADDDYDLEDLEGETTSIEGIITNFMGLDDFEVAGKAVDASDALLTPDDPDDFKNGVRVRVRGVVVDGVLDAARLRLRGSDVRLRAELAADEDIDLDAGEITLLGITVLFDLATLVENDNDDDDEGDDDSDSDVGAVAELSGVGAGDFLSIRGFDDGTGTIIATRIEVEDEADDVILRGPLEALDEVGETITVLGVVVPVDEDTEFDIEDASVDTMADFFALATIGDHTKVKDEEDDDNTSIDVADEVETESDDDEDSDEEDDEDDEEDPEDPEDP